jgi:hypothetical protein
MGFCEQVDQVLPKWGSLELASLLRIWRDELVSLCSFNFAQNLHSDSIVSLIRLKSKAFIGLHGIKALVLQTVRTNFVGEADPRPSWLTYSNTPRPSLANRRKAFVELCTAVAADGTQHIARETLRVHAQEN